MNKPIFILILLLFLPSSAAESLTITGRADNPVYEAGVVVDHNGFIYSALSNGLYSVEYGGHQTLFGFGSWGIDTSQNERTKGGKMTNNLIYQQVNYYIHMNYKLNVIYTKGVI